MNEYAKWKNKARKSYILQFHLHKKRKDKNYGKRKQRGCWNGDGELQGQRIILKVMEIFLILIQVVITTFISNTLNYTLISQASLYVNFTLIKFILKVKFI